MRLRMAPLTWAQTNCSTSSPPSISFPNWPSTMSPILKKMLLVILKFICAVETAAKFDFTFIQMTDISVILWCAAWNQACPAVGQWGGGSEESVGELSLLCLGHRLCTVYCDTDCVLVRLHLSAAHSPTLSCSLILKCTEHKSAEHHWALEQYKK